MADAADELRRYGEALERSVAPVAFVPAARSRARSRGRLKAVAAVVIVVLVVAAVVVVRRATTTVRVGGDRVTSTVTVAPTTRPEPAATVQPFGAGPAATPCRLTRSANDFSGLRAEPDTWLTGSYGEERKVTPPPASIDTHSPPMVTAVEGSD